MTAVVRNGVVGRVATVARQDTGSRVVTVVLAGVPVANAFDVQAGELRRPC